MTPDPPTVASLLIAAFVALEALDRRRARTLRAPGADRGTSLVLWGCCAVALLALNTSVPSPLALPRQVEWIGLAGAACGLGLRMRVAFLGSPSSITSSALERASLGGRFLEHLGHLAIWIGVTTASGNLIAILTVTIATLAVTVLHISADRTASGRDTSLEEMKADFKLR